MDKKVFQIFIRVFCKTVLVLLAMILVGTGTYFATIYYYKGHKDKVTELKKEGIEKMISKAQIDEISKNLIFVTEEGNKDKVKYLILEIFDTNENKMTYITVPAKTQLTISSKLYQKIMQVSQEIPQIFTVRDIPKYFGNKEAYAYGVVLFEDYFDIDISYYTVMTETQFSKAFEETDDTVEYTYISKNEAIESVDTTGKKAATQTSEQTSSSATTEQTETVKHSKVIKVQFKQDFLEKIASYDTKEKLSDYIETEYKDLNSNLEYTDKIGYVNAYLKVNRDEISYVCIPGRKKSQGYFTPDLGRCKKLFKETHADAEVKSSEETTAKDSESDKSEESEKEKKKDGKDSRIMILNGAGVTGLAAFYQEKLEKAGYKNVKTGNYSKSVVSKTLIYVADESLKEAVSEYFSGATVTVQKISDDVDIEIVVGTEAAKDYKK